MPNDELLFADASVIINLLGTGSPSEILENVATPIGVPPLVVGEVRKDPADGTESKGILLPLLEGGHLRQVELDDHALEIFFDLVGAPRFENLGDGEASAIACAVVYGGGVVIDERKARRICKQKYPALKVLCTMDLFKICLERAAVDVEKVIGWIENALERSRMGIPYDYRDWYSALRGRLRCR